MIYITVVRKNQNIVAIEATGHSGYASAGSDIVCSAISVLLQNAVNSIEELVKVNVESVVDENRPYLSIKLPEQLEQDKMHDIQLIMASAYLGVKNVAGSYSNYIKIKEI